MRNTGRPGRCCRTAVLRRDLDVLFSALVVEPDFIIRRRPQDVTFVVADGDVVAVGRVVQHASDIRPVRVTVLKTNRHFGARQQHAYSPILRHAHQHTHVDWGRIFIVLTMLVFAVGTNITINVKFPEMADAFPFIGVAVWAAILLTVPVRRHDWEVLPDTIKGSVFLLSLVLCASMMPVEELPAASWLGTWPGSGSSPWSASRWL